MTWSDILELLRVEVCAGVPASELSELYRWDRSIVCSREDEAVALAAGYGLGSKRCLVAIQSSGFGNALNAISSLILAYQLPLILLISIRAGDTEENIVQSILGSKVQAILETLGVHCVTPETAEQIAAAPAQSATSRVALLCSPILLKKIKLDSHGK